MREHTKWKNKPLQRRLTISYMLLIVLVVTLICFAILGVFFTSMQETKREELGLKLEQLSQTIVSHLEDVVHIGNLISRDEKIMEQLNSLQSGDLSEHLNQGYIAQSTTPLIAKLIIVNRNLDLLDPMNSRLLYQDAILLDPDFSEFLNAGRQVLLSEPGIFPIAVDGENNGGDLTVVLYQRIFTDQGLL
ncbi:MAG: hypothetical protein PF495_08820, partial [Spirochaetales bacterium]|nr:hypothetical protein [Spirochaetales bacterium]